VDGARLGKKLFAVAARLRALTRRARGHATATLHWRDIVLDPASTSVLRGDEQVRLSRCEFSILRALMDRPGQILSKAQLEERLYGWQEEIESNTIEVHVHHWRTSSDLAL
jgi:two-component system response regulator QseB